jgi:hypothetical protein
VAKSKSAISKVEKTAHQSTIAATGLALGSTNSTPDQIRLAKVCEEAGIKWNLRI